MAHPHSHHAISTIQSVLGSAGLGGLAHPIRRLHNPGGSAEFPLIGKAPAIPASALRFPTTIGPLFHGSTRAYGLPTVAKGSKGGLYGHGIYLTDSPRLASTYARLAGTTYKHRYKTLHFQDQESANRYMAQYPHHTQVVDDPWAGTAFGVRSAKPGSRTGEEITIRHYEKPIPKEAPNVRIHALQAQKILDVEKPAHPTLIAGAINKILEKRLEAVRKIHKDTAETHDRLYGEITPPNSVIANSRAHALQNAINREKEYAYLEIPRRDALGHDVYEALARNLGEKKTYKFLRSHGYDALRYDGGKRLGGEFHNVYVALHDAAVKAMPAVPELGRWRALSNEQHRLYVQAKTSPGIKGRNLPAIYDRIDELRRQQGLLEKIMKQKKIPYGHIG
jgi:hypothetical protein